MGLDGMTKPCADLTSGAAHAGVDWTGAGLGAAFAGGGLCAFFSCSVGFFRKALRVG